MRDGIGLYEKIYYVGWGDFCDENRLSNWAFVQGLPNTNTNKKIIVNKNKW